MDSSALARPHALYRFFNAADQLIYVGISVDPARRFTSHGDESPWWPEVSRITIERYPDRRAALDAEIDAIRTEYPIYNVAGKPCRRRPSPARQTKRLSAPGRRSPDLVWAWQLSLGSVGRRVLALLPKDSGYLRLATEEEITRHLAA